MPPYGKGACPLQRGPGDGPWPTQNFGWVGHNVFGPPIITVLTYLETHSVCLPVSMSICLTLLSIAALYGEMKTYKISPLSRASRNQH